MSDPKKHSKVLQSLSAEWPVPTSGRKRISSTFGPRIKLTRNGYDFHRGIDISGDMGTPVVAALPGTLYKYETEKYVSGGNTIVLDHLINGELAVHTYYMHLDKKSNDVTEGMDITKGQVIGYVGNSGTGARNPHLHFEIRVGCRLSLEKQISDGFGDSGFDPHVHPLILYGRVRQQRDICIKSVRKLSMHEDGILFVEMDRQWPIIKRYELLQGSAKTMAVLDVDTREGFDSKSTQAIDTQDCSMPYIQPFRFDRKSSLWRVEYRIPKRFARHNSFGNSLNVRISDVFDNFQICYHV